MRRAKIVCTLGPSAEAVDRLVELLNAGMNVARLNMSHGDYTEHGTRLKNVREAQHLTGKAVGVFADLQGPKIRLGRFEDNLKPHLEVGDVFTITIEGPPGERRMDIQIKDASGNLSNISSCVYTVTE